MANNWKKKPLGSLCNGIGDGVHGTPNYVTNSPYHFINGNNLKDGKVDTSSAKRVDTDEYLKHFIELDNTTLLMSINGTLGSLALYRGESVILGKSAAYIRCKDISRDFCYYYFQLRETQRAFFNIATGSTIKNLSLDSIKNFNIPVPSVNEQNAISGVLSTLDAKIDLNHQINGELEGMAKLLYDYWFVQFDFPLSAAQAAALGKPRLAGKPYRSSGGPMVYHPQLKREIPKGWESGTAKDLFVLNPAISIKKGAVAAYVDMDALPTSGFMTKQIQRKEFNGGTKFKNGDVLVARITPCLENGKTGLVSLLEEDEAAFGSTEFIVMRGRSLPLSGFGCCLGRSDYFRKYAIANMTGTSGRKRLEAPILEKIPLSIPEVETLAAFEKICHPLLSLMTKHTKQNQELIALRDWLLPMLMNGQVTVR